MKSLHQNSSLIRPQRHQVLLLMHNHPAYGYLPLLLQRLQHQEVRFLTILIRDEVVARIKIDRIQFVRIYELENLHKSSRSNLELLKLLLSDSNILSLLNLKPTDNVLPRNLLAILRTYTLEVERTLVSRTQEAKPSLMLGNCPVRLDRYAYQSKADRSLPYRSRWQRSHPGIFRTSPFPNSSNNRVTRRQLRYRNKLAAQE